MQGKDEIVYNSSRDIFIKHDHLAPCLYTLRTNNKGYADCNTSALATASDEYALLRNCYDTDMSSTTFGQRKPESDTTMVAAGHKCPYPVIIRTKPTGGKRLWNLYIDLEASN